MRLTSAQIEAKGILEQASKNIGYTEYQFNLKDLDTFFEQCQFFKNNREIIATELVRHIQEFGRDFL